MSLPFLPEHKNATPSIRAMRTPDDPSHDGLLSAASDLLSAIEAKDLKKLCSALDSFFVIRDAMPHQEYDGEDE